MLQDVECVSGKESLQAEQMRLNRRACTAGEQGHDEHAAAGGALHHVGHAQSEVSEGAHLQARLRESALAMTWQFHALHGLKNDLVAYAQLWNCAQVNKNRIPLTDNAVIEGVRQPSLLYA